MSSNKDHLSEDTNLPNGQKWVCLSFFIEDKKVVHAVKIRGCFEKYEDACEHAKELQGLDKYHHVFVGEMGKWLPFNPNPDDVDNSEYGNKDLNELMKGYKKNQERAKLYHESRKNTEVTKNIDENIVAKFKNKKSLKEKLKEDISESERKDIEHNLLAIDKELKDMEKKRKEIEDMEKDVQKDLNELKDEN